VEDVEETDYWDLNPKLTVKCDAAFDRLENLGFEFDEDFAFKYLVAAENFNSATLWQVFILFIGGKFANMRDKIPHGRWGSYIERNFDLSIKTANIWIRAWENRGCALAVNDWGAYMRELYGNEPKKLKAPKHLSDQNEDDNDDDEQSGGEGFGAGLGEPTISADKGKPGFYGYKNLVAMLDRDFFGSKAVTREEKLQFITELTKYLENQRKNLGS
jgi:hypothetical protein